MNPVQTESIEPRDAEIATKGIVACGLTKVFQDRRGGLVEAAADISFSCEYGEVVGLLGPNGAGKTTTLRLLSTVLKPSSGTATVAGADVVQEALDVRRRIGYLSSNTGLYERLTARETLEYFGSLHGMDPDELPVRIEETMERFGMGDFADVRCEKLSTGMKQKVSIARAVLHDPPVLILDEPTLGLDILVASTMIRFIQEYRERGKCIVFSTHIMGEVEKLCDRIAVIYKGKMQAVGTLDELREKTGERFLEDIFLHLIGAGEERVVPC